MKKLVGIGLAAAISLGIIRLFFIRKKAKLLLLYKTGRSSTANSGVKIKKK